MLSPEKIVAGAKMISRELVSWMNELAEGVGHGDLIV